MTDINITWLTDEHDCETCGSTYADGAIVCIDDKIVLNLAPVAHCFDGVHYNREDVLRKILKYLGHTLHEVSEND